MLKKNSIIKFIWSDNIIKSKKKRIYIKDINLKKINKNKLIKTIISRKKRDFLLLYFKIENTLSWMSIKKLIKYKLLKYPYKYHIKVTQTSRKNKLKTNNKIINNFINRNRQCKTMDKQLSNFNS